MSFLPDDEHDALRAIGETAFTKLSQPSQAATKSLLHPSTPIEHEDAAFTDAAHAQRFADNYSLDLRFHHRRGVWLWYDHPLWRQDNDGRIVRQVIQFAKQCQRDAMELRRKEERERAVGFYFKQESNPYIRRTIDLAKNLYPLADAGIGWDADIWRVGAPNGIINLKSGLLEPGDPADKISYSVRVPYDETCAPPIRWLRFLNEIFDGETTLVEFVQRYCGYALTGCTTEQVLALFYGHGANGKSTFLNVLAYVYGDYSHNMPFSAVELKNRSAIPSDLAALDGRRFVTASETTDGTRLNEARIKALTGSDPMTARFMHSDFFTFQPVAKFVLAVNHKPAVADDSYGFWRRIRLVPFVRTFSGLAKDDQLEATLRGESQGILRWLVEGCLKWQSDGLTNPTLIRDATDSYQQDSDPIGEFIEENCELEVTAVISASELQAGYQKWADKNNLHKLERLNRKDFGRRMSEKFVRKHTHSGWVYCGVKLVTHNMF